MMDLGGYSVAKTGAQAGLTWTELDEADVNAVTAAVSELFSF